MRFLFVEGGDIDCWLFCLWLSFIDKVEYWVICGMVCKGLVVEVVILRFIVSSCGNLVCYDGLVMEGSDYVIYWVDDSGEGRRVLWGCGGCEDCLGLMIISYVWFIVIFDDVWCCVG